MEKVETQLFPVRELKHKFESKRDIYKALKYQSKWTSIQTIVLVKLCLPSFRNFLSPSLGSTLEVKRR